MHTSQPLPVPFASSHLCVAVGMIPAMILKWQQRTQEADEIWPSCKTTVSLLFVCQRITRQPVKGAYAAAKNCGHKATSQGARSFWWHKCCSAGLCTRLLSGLSSSLLGSCSEKSQYVCTSRAISYRTADRCQLTVNDSVIHGSMALWA